MDAPGTTLIIGLTGLNAAGKGTVAEWLMSRGYAYHSLSDAIRDVLSERGQPPTRENMIAAGRELRTAGGPGALARHILGKLDPSVPNVVDSFRSPGEVEVFREHPSFTLWNVLAPESVRFDRIRSRARIGDPEDLETFRRLEAAELTGNAAGQQLIATAELADQSIDNAGDNEALNALVALAHGRASDRLETPQP
jgi:dephospho-CoA kinase